VFSYFERELVEKKLKQWKEKKKDMLRKNLAKHKLEHTMMFYDNLNS